VISATSDPLNIASSGIALQIYDSPRGHRLQHPWDGHRFEHKRSTELGVGLALAAEKP
jgi:hypothetical protein